MRKLILLCALLVAAVPLFAQNFIPFGGVNSQTASYAAVTGDIGKTIVMNCATCTLTLPNPAPYAQWTVMVSNLNASTLTVSNNGLNIDGAAASVTLLQNQGLYITSDGTNYFTSRGIGGSGGLGDPGSNGIVKRTGLNVTSIAAAADVYGLWSGCSASTWLRGDGNCTTPTWAQIAAGSSTVANTVGGAGSFSPVSNTMAQIAATQLRGERGLVAPTVTVTNTGGSIISGHSIQFAYTINTALGESLPSVLVSGGMNTFSGGACVSSTCTVTAAAPTLLTGQTSWNAYFCDSSNGPCSTPQKVVACTNLAAGVPCTITTALGTNTSSLPTVRTDIVQPPNMQATLCPPGTQNFFNVPDASGNWWTQAGMDFQPYNGTPQTPDGTFTFCRRTFFNDTQGAQPFKNAFVAMAHTAGTGTNAAVQDRTAGFSLVTPVNDSATRWGLEVVQAEFDNNCNGCATNGSPDGERTVFSGQYSDQATTNYTAGTYGPSVARLQYFKSGAGQSTSNGSVMRVVNSIFSMNNAAAVTGGTEAQIYYANCNNANGGVFGMDCAGMALDFPGTRFTNGTGALELQNTGAAAGGASPGQQDWIIKSFKHGLVSWMNGLVGLTEIDNTDPQALPVNASLNVTGSVNTNQVATNWSPGYTASCSGGASTYTYELVAVDNLGGVAPGLSFNANNCTNPLTSGNPVTLSPGAGGPTQLTGLTYRQAIRIDVYRTGGPMATGKIGSLTCNTNIPILGCSAFSDTGLAAGAAVPTVNTFGGLGNAGDDNFTNNKGQHKNTQAANNDFAGTCTLASATPSTCTVTFTRAYTAAPVCVATNQTTQANPIKAAPTTTNVVFTGPNTVTDVVAYICVGNPN